MHVNELMTLIKDSGPKLNACSMRDLERLLKELWVKIDKAAILDLHLIRYRRRKRIVVGAYWLGDCGLRCITIKRNAVYVSRYMPKSNKIYTSDKTTVLADVVNTRHYLHWCDLLQVPVCTWLQRTLAPTAPAIADWQRITTNGTLRDPVIQRFTVYQGNDYAVIKKWVEGGVVRLLVLGLEENRLVAGVLSVAYDTVSFSRISDTACTELLLTL